MAVDRGRQPLLAGRVERIGQRLVPRSLQPRKLHRQILQAVGGLQPGLQPRWRVGLARLQHVGVVLRVGGQAEIHDAEVGVEHVARLNHAARIGLLALSPDHHRRLEPLAESHLDHALPHPPHHVFVRRLAGRYHLVREGLANHHVRHFHRVTIGFELLRQLYFEPTHGEHLGRLDLRRVRGTERLDQPPLLVCGDAVGVPVDDRLDETTVLVRIVLEVRVLDDDDVARRVRGCRADRRALALIDLVHHEHELVVGRVGGVALELLEHGPRPVLGAVVDDDDLLREPDRADALEEDADGRDLVVDGNQYG